MDSADGRQRLQELLASQHLAVLATSDGDLTHASLVAFSVSEDLKTILFASQRATRKFKAISRNPHVSLLVDNRSNKPADFNDAIAVTVHGRAVETDKVGTEHMQRYIDEHPALREFVSEPSCALISVQVERYDLVSSFQDVLEIRIDG